MSLILTYWEDPATKKDPEDFDEISSIVLTTVRQIPHLVKMRPYNCTMISTQRSASLKNRGTKNEIDFKERWRKIGDPTLYTNVTIPKELFERLKVYAQLCNVSTRRAILDTLKERADEAEREMDSVEAEIREEEMRG